MKRIFLLPLLLSLGLLLHGKPALPEILSDGMVLQQNSKVNIWGKGDRGKTVVVKPSWSDTVVRAKVDNDGNWLAVIETPAASFTPCSISVSDGEEVVLKDILIGEVWLASGQSNMEMPLYGWNNNPILRSNETIALSGQYPAIRFVTIPRTQSFEPLESVEGRWQVCNPENSPEFSATAFFFAQTLQEALNVPVGMIVSSWGGSRVEAWIDRETLETYSDINLNEEEVNKLPAPSRPLLMYNGMIHPIKNYVVNGFIWYQGESNVGAHQVYAERLHNMVNLWRKQWNNTDLPFYSVEIAPFIYSGADNTEAALLREAQFKSQKLIPHSGVVSTNDLVEPHELRNIHPRNKTDIGKRLAFLALNKTYGFNRVVAHGPEYSSMEVKEGKIFISFDHAPDGFNRGDGIEGFEIAGEDGVFLPAVARENWGKIEVSREGLDKPIAVRYCFKNFQIGNLTGAHELPVVPFRTDSFEK
ncbi:sialate O-acetylesterase [Proteiniphilum sp.]|nr:sialate O-acetylesterase [Proteiniphilum sp.]MEA4917999.1 sialate O-acetylesterase [Proteiniphilum sp.]